MLPQNENAIPNPRKDAVRYFSNGWAVERETCKPQSARYLHNIRNLKGSLHGVKRVRFTLAPVR